MHNRYRLACSATVAAAAASLLVAAPAAADPSASQSPTSSASATDSSTQWRDQFNAFVKSLPGAVHMSITPAGSDATESAGTSDAGSASPPAWGTIRVPLGLAAIRASRNDSSTATEVSTAIGSSDATSSNALIRSLGSGAARSVQSAMANLGDRHTRVASATDYAALARTPWAVGDQSLFGARLLCSQDRSPVTTPMLTRSDPAETSATAADSATAASDSSASAGAVTATSSESDARNSTTADPAATTASAATSAQPGSSTTAQWGLQRLSGGSVQHVAAHGGWGPAADGRYAARQMALVQTARGLSSIAVAASPTEPGQTAATGLVDKVAGWLQEHLTHAPAGFCDAADAKAAAGAAAPASTSTAQAGGSAESSASSAASAADGQDAADSPTALPEAGAVGAEASSPATTSSTSSSPAPQPQEPTPAPATTSAPAPASAAPTPSSAAAPQLVAPQQVCRPTVVALDPGHSPTHVEPFDPVTGAKMVDDPNGAEGDDNLYVANAVKTALERSRGYKVVLLKTRADEQVNYRERIARAEQAGAAIGVSIHTSPGDNAIFPQRDGLFREGPGADGATKRVTFTDAELATRSQLYSTKFSAARQAAEGHSITIRDNSFNGRAPLWSGNIPIISLISQKVPWVYNEFGPASGAGGANAVAHTDLDKYATGIADGIRAATPAAKCGE
ncbi:N-acetylmuramoyl-L-alanine amidase [Gordonia otitidis]|uniref:N-acetylmuramoyl-L-alanine amidase n=1 Tax=Gordonia otitidis TaxID=249058 RepID=UPI001F2F90BD|nr:N-acetylmuramoyl-L-alanine amidase [Gordonia otitidis]